MDTLLTSTKDIEERVRWIDQITDWSPVPLGSILRATSYSYRNWGIGITPENIGWLYGASQEAYSVEWKDTDESLNDLVGKASENAGLRDVNKMMNIVIGEYAAEYVRKTEIYGLTVLDIGAGTGATSMAMLSTLGDAASRINLFLVEPSKIRTDAALESIRKISETLANAAVVYNMTETEAILHIPYTIDMAITNAAMHHNSFNFHLREISKVLVPGAPLIMGDWYDGLSEKPERVYWLLLLLANYRDVDMEKDVIGRIREGLPPLEPSNIEERNAIVFRKSLDLDMNSCIMAFQNLTENERKADAAIMKFWLEVGRIFAKKGENAPIYMIEGHERAWRRETAIAESGFCFDKECQEKYKLVTRDKGNLNVVSMAKKGPVGAIRQH